MPRFLAVLGCLVLAVGNVPAQAKKEQGPTELVLTPAKPPVPSLRFTLLPELREQSPGNGATHFQKAGELLAKMPGTLNLHISQWQQLPLADLPRDEVRKVLAEYKEPLELLHKGARSEFCDFQVAQGLREKGIAAPLEDLQRMRRAAALLCLKARLELVEDRPDQTLRTLQTVYALARYVGDEPTLICSLIGVALTAMANQVLELALCHPKTPNLSASLMALPQPFIDMRRPFQGERLWAYGTFPGLLEVVNNPDAGPLPPEQIAKMTAQLGALSNSKLSQAERVLLALNIRRQHEAATKALMAAGRSREQLDKWPHIQVALMHSLLEFDQFFDEMLMWQGFPYYQAAEPLQALEKKTRAAPILGPDSPAIPLARLLLPATQKVRLARERLDRQFAAFRLIEAIRLYAANHDGKLPPTLADIKEVPLPVCPLTGKNFTYRVEGERAFLSAPPVPPTAASIQPLHYEITLKQRPPDSERPKTGQAPRKLRVLVLEGTPRQRGLAHGKALQKQIHQVLKLWKAELAATYKMDADAFIQCFVKKTDYLSAMKKWTPDLVEEIEGIAEGAGVDFPTLYVFQLVDEVWAAGPEVVANQCSSLGFSRNKTQPSIIAQNLDLPPFYDGFQLVLHIKSSDSDLESFVLTVPGLIALNGVNNKSVGVCCNTLLQLSYCRDGLPVACVVRGVLQQRSEKEAADFLHKVKHASGQNYILGGPDRALDLECSASKISPFVPKGQQGIVWHTNHPLVNDDYTARYRLQKEKNEVSPKEENTRARLACLEQRLGKKAADLDLIKSTLAARDSDAYPVSRALGKQYAFTFAATIMVLSAEPEFHVAPGPPHLTAYQRLAFSKRK